MSACAQFNVQSLAQLEVQYNAHRCEKGDVVSIMKIIEDWAVVSAGRDEGPGSGVARSSGCIAC